MKTPFHLLAAFIAICLTALSAFTSSVQAAPPDLTAAGVIATIDRSATYNLGPTGLRGWIYLSGGAGNTHGQDGTMTSESRQILVTVASAPGNAVLAVDDVLLGAMAGSGGTVPNFSSDARKSFGAAIGEAEKTGAGTLRVKRWRAGTTTDENIPIAIMGDYTTTAPYSCPKSALILANARNKLVSQMLADANFPGNDWAGAINALALLAGVQSGDPDYAAVQTRLQTYARARATAGPVNNGLPIWDWGYMGIFLAEYYLSTGDANVLPGISQFSVKLAQSQSMLGTFGHGLAALRADGSGRRSCIGYGPVNAAGIPANLAIVMGKKALLAGGQAIHPEIDPAIQRGSDFLAYYVNKGSIPYGEHGPGSDSHSSNGKDPMCAVFFGVQSGRPLETEYFTRMSIADFNGREYGHTGQGFSYLWGAMGANMGGSLATAEYLKNIRWHLDLSRRTDGSFAYDGGEQYGGGTTSGGTYLGDSSYYGLSPTASYILTYALPLQRLHITGKAAAPANTLDSTKVAAAVAAATFKQDCPSYTNAQLITYLSDYDPVVRHHAAVVLASRPPTSNEITNTLLPMITGPDTNGRMGAIQTLGILKDASALPLIAGRLADTDLWVRAKAATAIRSYTSATASAQLTPMLNAFIANATDPDAIEWSDPVQIANGYLSLALFGNAVPDGSPGNNVATYTINASKGLLYPAVKAGLKQPDSYPRTGAGRFFLDRLPLADVQALMPDLFEVIQFECQADRMWSASPRASGISTMSKHKIKEGISLALEMLVVPENFGWGADEYLIAALNALAVYGDAARWTLPTLRSYLSTWSPTSSQYTTLVNTIASIENAITSPVLIPGKAVANPQVVVTTTATAITLTGTSPRTTVTFASVTNPAHGTLSGTAPNLTYTPNAGYTGPDHFTFQTTDVLTISDPGTISIIVGTAGSGLKGEYFDNTNFTNLKLTRTDAQVNFDWGTGSPNAALGSDTFSVRWDGLLLVPETGTYTFSTLNSDGVRLYVNGLPVIDDYVDQTTNWKDGPSIALTKGQWVDLHMLYYENTGSAVAKLKWTGPSFAGANGAIIGSQWLYDGTGMIRTPYAHAQSVTTVGSTPQAITLSGSGGTLVYTVINPPAHGTLTGTAPNLTYTPAANYSGTDSFTFLVNNGTSNSNPATVSIGIWAGQPVDFFWAAATSGNWSGATSWTNAAGATVVPDAAGQPFYRMSISKAGTYSATQDLAGFLLNQLNTAGTVTLAGTNSLTFAANGTLLPQFNQNSSSAVAVSIPLSLNSTTNFGGTSGGKVTITGRVSGPGGLTKDSAGELHLYSTTANNYSGGTVVNDGTLHLGAIIDGISPLFSNPMGSGPVTLNNGTIELERVSASNPLTVNGGALLSDNGWGASWSGPITLNATVTVNASWGLTCSGTISGSGGFTKLGTNTLALSGSNSFTGPNKITAGTLTCTNSAAIGTGPLDIITGAKVNLNFTGNRTISELKLNSGAPLAPGTYGSTTSPATNKNDTYFSGNGTVTILPQTTTTLALTSGSTPASPGTPLTFTATVTGTSPTGNVAFYSGASLLASSSLNGSSQASYTTSSLAIGSHTITAQYAGNATNATSTSAALPVEIISLLPPAPTNLIAAAGNNRVGLTWSLSTGASSYYVKRSLTNGGPYTVIGNPGNASYDDLTAVNGTTYYYVVSAINIAGESTNSNQASGVPGPQPSDTTIVSSPVATGPYDTAVTFTATVTVSGGPATGSITFKDGATVVGTGTLDGAGQAGFTTSALAVAGHSITATYGGDGTYVGSISAPMAYVVTPKALTITGVTASGRIYDGNASAYLTAGAVSGGVVGGETVTVVPGSGTFASPNAGTWAVTATGYSLGGANAGNYQLSAQPTVPNATITPRPVQLSGTRIYNATALAVAADLTISNKVGADDLTLSGSADLASKDVGTRALLVNSATPARVQSATGNTGSLGNTTFDVNLTANPVAGNTLVAVISTRGNSANRISGISGGGVTWSRVSQATNTNGTTTEIWVGSNVSNGTMGITITQASLRSAAVVIEYSGIVSASPLDQIAGATGTGTAAVTGTTPLTSQANELWIGGLGIRDGRRTLNSPYGNNFTVVASPKSGSLSGDSMIYALEKIVNSTGAASSGGTLSASDDWSGTIATFKSASSSTLALTGTAAGNYTLTGLTGSMQITPKALTLATTPAVTGKTYDGLAAATLAGATLRIAEAPGAGTTGDGIPYTGDAVAVVLSGTFDSKDAGSGKAVTSTSTLGGANAGNYSLTQPVGLTGTITPKALTLTATPAVTSKTYDGLTAAALTGATLRTAETPGAGTTIDGIPYTGDAVAVVLSGTFNTRNAATGKAVTSTSTLSGAQKDNYTLTQPVGLTGAILPADLTITADNQTKTYGQTLAFGSGATQFASSGLLDGETIGSVALSCAGGGPAADAGSYPITPSAATGGSFSATNYAINHVAGLLTVSPALTTTILTGSGSPANYGDPVTLTATVVPTPLGGTVQFHDNAVALGSPVPLSGGQAQRVTNTLAAGSHTITATYSGSTNHSGSNATAMTQTVEKAAPAITTPPTATDITYGQTLASSSLSGGVGSVAGTFAFTAPATAPPVGTATHSVTFTPADTLNYQTATTSVSVTVKSAETPFEAWAADPAHGLTQGLNDGPLDDPDHDGYSNLMEFVLGGAPMVSSQVIQPKLTQAGGNRVFSYHRSHLSDSSTTQMVEYGDGLTGWTPLIIPADTAGAVTITPGASSDHVEVSIPPQGANGFARLKVVTAP